MKNLPKTVDSVLDILLILWGAILGKKNSPCSKLMLHKHIDIGINRLCIRTVKCDKE